MYQCFCKGFIIPSLTQTISLCYQLEYFRPFVHVGYFVKPLSNLSWLRTLYFCSWTIGDWRVILQSRCYVHVQLCI